MILLDISIFILSFISVCWSAESPSNKEYNRPPLTSHTFYPPSCLDQEYKNVRAKKKVHRRPPLTSQTFIPPPPSEQRFLAQQSQIAAAPTLQKNSSLFFKKKKMSIIF